MKITNLRKKVGGRFTTLQKLQTNEGLAEALLDFAKRTQPRFQATLSVRPENANEELTGVLAGRIAKKPAHKLKHKTV